MSSNVHALERIRTFRAKVQRPGRADVEAAFRTIIRWTGDDPERDGLIETPARARYLPRLRTSLPAFDRASLQRRAEFRSVPADYLRRSGGYRRARPFLQLRRREGSAG